MFNFKEQDLAEVLKNHEGVDLISYGKPRDAFQLSINVPNFTSGYGGNYEMVHTNVPKGVMIGVGDIEKLDFGNFDNLKKQLSTIDIYPLGHSGDYSGKNIDDLIKWFTDRSVRDDKINPQEKISGIRTFTPEGLGDKYNELVAYLSDELHIFKIPESKGGGLNPASKEDRAEIVMGILSDLSNTVRYTRLDAPAKAYQMDLLVAVDKGDNSQIDYKLSNQNKILVVREEKEVLKITPLDRDMIGVSYVTKDGEPLGNRGTVDASDIFLELAEKANRENTKGRLSRIKEIVYYGQNKDGSGPEIG